jgi:hypothetical protein
MKLIYEAPVAEVVDFAAMEAIAVVIDPKSARDGDPGTGTPGVSGGVGGRGDDY